MSPCVAASASVRPMVADLGLGEDRSADQRVVDGGRVVVEHGLGEGRAFADGHRGQLRARPVTSPTA